MSTAVKRKSKKEKDPNVRACKACGVEHPIEEYQKYGQEKTRRLCNECLQKVEAIKTPKSKKKTNREMMIELSEKLEVIAQKDVLSSLEDKFESKVESLREEMKEEFRLVKEEILRVLERGMKERDLSEKLLLEEIRRTKPELLDMVKCELREWRRLVEQVGSGAGQQSPRYVFKSTSPMIGSGNSSVVGSGESTPKGKGKGKRTSIYTTQELSRSWIEGRTDEELKKDIERVGVAKATSKSDQEVMELLELNQTNLIKERNRRGLKAK